MSERRISLEKESALVRLLDDESHTVQSALLDELKRLGDDGISLLKKQLRYKDSEASSRARELLKKIQGYDTIEDFVAFIRSLNYELETGCILLNRTVVTDLDTVACCRELDRIGQRCRELMVLPASPWDRCKVINRVLFHECEFRGNPENFDDPHNSFLGSVIARRKGIPISLSILYVLVAQRCDLNLELIGIPGRFMVGCFLEDRPFFIDPYERGRIRNVGDVKAVVSSNNIKPRHNLLAPTPVGEVLCRCCRNLVHQYAQKKKPMRSRLFLSFVREFEATYRRHCNPLW